MILSLPHDGETVSVSMLKDKIPELILRIQQPITLTVHGRALNDSRILKSVNDVIQVNADISK